MQYKLRVGTLKHTLDALHVPRSRVKENKLRFLLGTGGMTTQPGDTVSVEKDNPEVAVACIARTTRQDHWVITIRKFPRSLQRNGKFARHYSHVRCWSPSRWSSQDGRPLRTKLCPHKNNEGSVLIKSDWQDSCFFLAAGILQQSRCLYKVLTVMHFCSHSMHKWTKQERLHRRKIK